MQTNGGHLVTIHACTPIERSRMEAYWCHAVQKSACTSPVRKCSKMAQAEIILGAAMFSRRLANISYLILFYW